MALVNISVPVSDKNEKDFQAFLKKLAGPSSPVPGDRLFKLAMGTFDQRSKNLGKQADNRKLLKLAREKGLTVTPS